MKLRMHRGGLAESMETMKECSNLKDIESYLSSHSIDVNTVECLYYADSDPRIGWEKVYMIHGRYKHDPSNNNYPLGFSDSFFVLPH
jgi:hypothetical protein